MQSAEERPDPTLQRKAAIAHGAALDHTGRVAVRTIPGFDLGRTIFQTLEGRLERAVMALRVGKEVDWQDAPAAEVQRAYEEARADHPLPPIDPALLRFMVEECDFDVEHADGSFLDHLYFCYEYTAHHYPQGSPVVMLLHSILGTGTNTFAMEAGKIPDLRALLAHDDWRHIESFPSILRLLYAGTLRSELRAGLGALDRIRSIRFHRVIDNEPIELSAEELWVQLNYQLIHLVDFLPVANWPAHQSDTSFIVFRDLHDLLAKAGKLEAEVAYTPASGPKQLSGEDTGVGGWLTTLIPVRLAEGMAARSVRRFSARIDHDLGYRIDWGG